MTRLLTIPEFARATGLSYRLCLHLVQMGDIPSVPVGSRRRIDVRWLERWLEAGGFPVPHRAESQTRTDNGFPNQANNPNS
jgi:excisionase family DNA binding protein